MDADRPSMTSAIKEPITVFLPLLRDEANLEKRAHLEAVLRRGLLLIPLSPTIREKIAEVYEIDLEKFETMDDDAILTLAFQALEEDRIIKALEFHAEVAERVFDIVLAEDRDND